MQWIWLLLLASMPLFTNSFLPHQKRAFYGLIGPERGSNDFASLYDMFTRDGIVQGVFLEDKNVTFVRHRIQTDKVRWAERGISLSPHFWVQLAYMVLNPLYWWPNMMGVANTSLLKIREKVYALYERDTPYEIDVDMETKTVQTRRKVAISGVHHISGHSKWVNQRIETIDCNMFLRCLTHLSFDAEWKQKGKRTTIPFHYIPIVHDFVWQPDSERLIVMDSPFVIDFSNPGPVPVRLAPFHPTFMYVVDTKTGVKETFRYDDTINVFHFAGPAVETAEGYEIYASVYEALDFYNLEIVGKYRRLRLDKRTGRIHMDRNPELEKESYNLDFPVSMSNERVISRNFCAKDRRNNGFVVTRGLDLVEDIRFDDRHILGEPQLVDDSFLCFFNKKDTDSFFSVWDLLRREMIVDYKIDGIEMGFHSLFSVF